MTERPANSSDDRLSAYHDGELSEEEARAFERELERSSEAQGVLREYEGMRSLLRELPREEVPGELHDRVMQRVSSGSQGGSRGLLRHWKLGLPVLATAAGIMFLVQFNPPRQERAEGDLENGVAARDTDTDALPELAPSTEPVHIAESAPKLGVPASGPKVGTDLSPEKGVGGGVEPGMMSVENTVSSLPARVVPDEVELGESESFPRSESEASTVVSSDGKRSFELTGEQLESLKVGETVQTLQRSGSEVSVVNLVVVDQQQALDSLQLILSSQKVPPQSEQSESKQKLGFTPTSESEAVPDASLVAVYVEASEKQLAGTLEELKREHQQFLELAIEESVESKDMSVVLQEQSVRSSTEEDDDFLETDRPKQSEDRGSAKEEAGSKVAVRKSNTGENQEIARFAARQQVIQLTPQAIGELAERRRSQSRDSSQPNEPVAQKSRNAPKANPEASFYNQPPTSAAAPEVDADQPAEFVEKQLQVLFVLKQRPQPTYKATIPQPTLKARGPVSPEKPSQGKP